MADLQENRRKTRSLNKYFSNLGWRLDHNKIFEKSQQVIPKVRAFFAKMIKNYFTIDYDSINKSNIAGFSSPVSARQAASGYKSSPEGKTANDNNNASTKHGNTSSSG